MNLRVQYCIYWILFALGLHDDCALDREAADPALLPSKWLSEVLLQGTKALLIVIFVQHYFYTRDARHGNVRDRISVSLLVASLNFVFLSLDSVEKYQSSNRSNMVLYSILEIRKNCVSSLKSHRIWCREMTTYSLLHFLRVFIGDFKCHNRPNSISGHYWFYLYYILGALFLIVDLKRSTHHFEHFLSPKIIRNIAQRRVRRQAMFLVGSYILFLFMALLTLYRTWAYGFHTQAQIHYGTIVK